MIKKKSIMEEESARRTRRNTIQDIVLGTVCAAGLIGVAFVVPNALMLMKRSGLSVHSRHDEVIKTATKSLVRQGMLEWCEGKLRITEKGKSRYEMEVAKMELLHTKKRWDKKWRILIFDIPERRRNQRIQLRRLVQGAGFVRLQDSVWAYPYPCEDFIALMKANLKVGKDVLYLIVDALENDAELRTHFKLK